jgi:hypothetical protein
VAMRRFDSRWASVSLFDSCKEIMKAEMGYSMTSFPRSDSIGAHVLLSGEVMVILDTHKVSEYGIGLKPPTYKSNRIGDLHAIPW